MDLGELVLRLRLDDQIGAGLGKTQRSITSFAGGLGKHGSAAGAQFGAQFGRGAGAGMGRAGSTLGRQLASGIGKAAVGGIAGSIGTQLGAKIQAGVSRRLASSKMFAGLTGKASQAGTEAGQKIGQGIGKGTSNINWSRLGKVGLAAAAIGAGVLFARDFNRAAEAGMGRLHPARIVAGIGSGLKTGITGLGSIVSRGLLGVTAGAGAIAGAGLGLALTKGFGRLEAIDSARGKLKGLGHDAQEVDKIMQNALASVKGTAFGLDDASTVAASAVAAGVKPGKELTSVLKLVGDAATIGGSSMSEMGGIFNRVKSSNKVMGDSLAQLGDQGIPIVQFLSKTMGKSADEVVNLASKGKINFKTFKQAMQDGLGGSAKASGDTLKGTLDNVGAAISRSGAGLLKGIFPQLKGVGSSITGALDRALPSIQKIGGSLGQAFKATLPTIKAFGGILGKAFGSPTDAAQKFADVVSTHQATILSFLIGGARLALAFGAALLQMASGGMKGFAFLMRGMASVQDGIVGMTGTIIHTMASAFSWVPGLGPKLAQAADGFDVVAAKSKSMTDAVRAGADGLDAKAAGIDSMVSSMQGAIEKLKVLGAAKIGGLKKQDEINGLKIALRGLPKSIKTKVETAYKKGGIEAALAKLKQLKDKRVRAQIEADAKNLPKLTSELKKLKNKRVKAVANGDWSQVDKLNAKIKKLKDRIVKAKVEADSKGADDIKNKTSKKNLPDRHIKVSLQNDGKGGGNVALPKVPKGAKVTVQIRSVITAPKMPALPKGRTIKIGATIMTPKLPKLPAAKKIRIGAIIATPKLPKMPKGAAIKVGVKTDAGALGKLAGKIAALKPKSIKISTKPDLSGVNKVASAAKLKPKAVTITTRASMGGISSVRSGLAGLHDKTVTITTVKKTVGGATGGLFTGSDFRFASGGSVRDVTRGGYVWGAGNGTSDSINARIAKGEIVQKEAAVRYYGSDFLLGLNRMAIPREALGIASRATVDTKPSKAATSSGGFAMQAGATMMPGAVQVTMPTASDAAAVAAANRVLQHLDAAGIR